MFSGVMKLREKDPAYHALARDVIDLMNETGLMRECADRFVKAAQLGCDNMVVTLLEYGIGLNNSWKAKSQKAKSTVPSLSPTGV